MRSFVILALFFVGMIPAWAAQMDVVIATDEQEIEPSFKFLRVIVIDYPQDGNLADQLRDQKKTVSFSADSKTQGMSDLISKINSDLYSKISTSFVTEAHLNYEAKLTGGEDSAFIEYKIEVVPTITNYIVRDSSGNSPGLYDAQWRGIQMDGPVIIETKYGSYDINNPSSLLKNQMPELWDDLKNSEAREILEMELIDASGILKSPLSRWHSLFDPTPIIEESKKAGFKETAVLTRYSLGECNIESGPCIDRKWIQEFSLDTDYSIKAIESQDDATISIEGYVTDTIIEDAEVFGVSSSPPSDYAVPATGEFPAMIMYGMAGMAAIGGSIFFVFSNRQLKKSEGQGQQGIDPSKLRAYSTSSSAGGYQTNRAEAQLVEDFDYQKTRTVYDETKQALPKNRGPLNFKDQ